MAPSANNILGSLLLNTGSPVGKLRTADPSRSALLQEHAKAIAQGRMDARQILLTTGFGLSASPEIPVRLPALMLPGLKILESLADLGLSLPTFIIYQATDFIAETNGIDRNQAHAVARRMAEYLHRYVRRFHPRIADHVQILFGTQREYQIANQIAMLSDDLRTRALQDTGIGSVIAELDQAERQHSRNIGLSTRYAAANIVYSCVNVQSYPFADYLHHAPMLVLPIGGNAEKPFFDLTSQYGDLYGERAVIPLLTQVGSRPTYYPVPQSGDPCSVADLQRLRSLRDIKDGPIRQDFEALEADGATLAELMRIYPDY